MLPRTTPPEKSVGISGLQASSPGISGRGHGPEHAASSEGSWWSPPESGAAAPQSLAAARRQEPGAGQAGSRSGKIKNDSSVLRCRRASAQHGPSECDGHVCYVQDISVLREVASRLAANSRAARLWRAGRPRKPTHHGSCPALALLLPCSCRAQQLPTPPPPHAGHPTIGGGRLRWRSVAFGHAPGFAFSLDKS